MIFYNIWYLLQDYMYIILVESQNTLLMGKFTVGYWKLPKTLNIRNKEVPF